MKKLEDQQYTDFSGGLRLDVAPLLLPTNAVQKAINVNFDSGRISKRLGYVKHGQPFTTDGSTKVDGMFTFNYYTTSTANKVIATEDGATAKAFELFRTWVKTTYAAGATSIEINTVGNVTATGVCEIGGDIITYTGKTGDILTGCSGATYGNAAGTPVRQWQAISGAVDAIYSTASFAQLDQTMFLSGSAVMSKYDGTTYADNGQNYSLVTNYGRKLYATYFPTNQIFFSNADDGATWTATDYFYPVKGDGRLLTSLNGRSDYLCIFKEDGLLTWDSYLLKERSKSIGAYNNKVVKEVGKYLYFTGSDGIYLTNGESISDILSEPIKAYLDDYTPTRDTASTGQLPINNISSGKLGNKYITWIGDTTTQDEITDCALVYDTVGKNWTTYSNIPANCFHNAEKTQRWNGAFNWVSNKYFFGNDLGQVYEYNTGYYDSYGSATTTRVDISSEVIFAPITLGIPNRRKKFGNLVAMSEVPGYELFYKIDDQEDWKPLGQVIKETQRFAINETGYRITLKISEVSKNKSWIFNGFVFEDAQLLED